MAKNDEPRANDEPKRGFLESNSDIMEDVRSMLREENLDLFEFEPSKLHDRVTKMLHVMYDVPLDLDIVSELRKQIGDTTYVQSMQQNELLSAVSLANAVSSSYYAKFESALFSGARNASELVQVDTLFIGQWLSYVHRLRERYKSPAAFLVRRNVLRPTITIPSHSSNGAIVHPWCDNDVRIILHGMTKNTLIYSNKKC